MVVSISPNYNYNCVLYLIFCTLVIVINCNGIDTYFSSWTAVEIQDRNLLKSRAISANLGNGVYILGGIFNNGEVSDSISLLDTANYDTTTFSDYLNPKLNVLPFEIYCDHQCSTKLNTDDIVIVSPQSSSDIIYDLWIFNPTNLKFTTYVKF